MGRDTSGVRVMNIRDDDQVSAVALVVESEAQTAAQVLGDSGDNGDNGAAPVDDAPDLPTDDVPDLPTDDAAAPPDEGAPDSE
jgi:hypothetical protein